MKVITHANVQILDTLGMDKETELKVWASKIETVYKAYRQCYCKHEPEVAKIDMQYVTAAHRILNDDNIFKNQGDIAYKVLHMCNFIQKHSNHQSPLEHMNITVRISDMSRACLLYTSDAADD